MPFAGACRRTNSQGRLRGKAHEGGTRNGLCRIWGLPRLPRRRKGRIAQAAQWRGRTGKSGIGASGPSHWN